LMELQDLDREIQAAEARVVAFDPELNELDEPVVGLTREVEALRSRVAEMKETERRLERGANEKRQRMRKYEDRLNLVRTAREEAAVRVELDLVRRAAETDEQEALELLEQITRTEVKLASVEKQLARMRAELEPKRQALLEERANSSHRLAVLRDRRANQALRLDPRVRQTYERVRAGRTNVVLAPLKAGACGHCYSSIPLQQQSEIQHGSMLFRCEACGVILYPED
jgi:uncharacterized protein